MSSSAEYPAQSFRLGVGGCGAVVQSGPGGRPEQCFAPVTRCGLLLRRRFDGKPPEAWLAFACDGHADRLVAARDLLPRDREVLDRWWAEERREYTAERPWQRPEPLATGGDAVQLVERARRWAETAASSS